MSHYDDVDDGYQPSQSMTDEQKTNPPKGGSGVPTKEDLTKEVLTELLLVIGEHSHPNQPIICRRAWELYGKLTGEEIEGLN